MISKEILTEANRDLPTTPIKGKQYVMVKDRVKAFRQTMPESTILTEIISMTEDSVTFKATIMDETGRVLATGHAQEYRNASTINKTSYIENCETSAIGRAIGLLGIGIDDSFGSADEVASAMYQQEMQAKPITDREKRVLDAMLTETNSDRDMFFSWIGKDSLDSFTKDDYARAVRALDRKKAK